MGMSWRCSTDVWPKRDSSCSSQSRWHPCRCLPPPHGDAHLTCQPCASYRAWHGSHKRATLSLHNSLSVCSTECDSVLTMLRSTD